MFDESEDFKILKTIAIPGEALSKKRSLRPVKRGAHAGIAHTQKWMDYEKETMEWFKKVEPMPADTFYPVYIHIWHYRTTKRMFDYLNLAQGFCDFLQGDIKEKDKSKRHAIIPEDDVRHCVPVHESPFAGWSVSKHNPRTVITITTDPYYLEPTDLTREGIIELIESLKETK